MEECAIKCPWRYATFKREVLEGEFGVAVLAREARLQRQ